MADRMVDAEHNAPTEDIEDVLKAVIKVVLDEAADKMEAGEDVIPFTGLAVKENLFIETHPGDNAEECFLAARKEGARGATAYAFCYDGYIDTEAGMRDALIAEGGLPGEEAGYAFAYLYDDKGIDREIVYVGPAPNFMEGLKLELDMEGSLDPTADPAASVVDVAGEAAAKTAASYTVDDIVAMAEEAEAAAAAEAAEKDEA